MTVQLWLAFVAASALLLVIPGPTILTVISYSVAHGRKATVPLVAAVALGDSTALFVSLLGLGALLAASALAFTIVKWIGGTYLLFLGLKLLRAGIAPAKMEAPAADAQRPETGVDADAARPLHWRRKLFANTYLVTALNPKGIVFFVAFLPQFITPTAGVARQLWTLALTFVALATVNATLYAAFAAGARRALTSPRAQRRFHVAGGSLLSVAGVLALLAKRPA